MIRIFCFAVSPLFVLLGLTWAVGFEVHAAASQFLYQLTIVTEPSEAKVSILNSSTAYVPGVRLPSGRYNILVSHPGYQEEKGYIEIQAKEWVGRVVLQPLDSEDGNKVAVDAEWQRISAQKAALKEAQSQLELDRLEFGKGKIEFDKAKLGLGKGKIELDKAKLALGSVKKELDRAKLELGKEKIEFDKAKMDLGKVKIELDKAKLTLGKVKIEIDKAKLVLGKEKKEIESKKKRLILQQIELAQVQYEIDAQRLEISEKLNRLERIEKLETVENLLPVPSKLALKKPVATKKAQKEPVAAKKAQKEPVLAKKAQEAMPVAVKKVQAMPVAAKKAQKKPVAAKKAQVMPVAVKEVQAMPVAAKKAQKRHVKVKKAQEKPVVAKIQQPKTQPDKSSQLPEIPELEHVAITSPKSVVSVETTQESSRPTITKEQFIELVSSSPSQDAGDNELQSLLDSVMAELRVYQPKKKAAEINSGLQKQIQILKDIAPEDIRVQKALALYEKRFIVVVGLFSKQDRAGALAKKLVGLGFPAYHELAEVKTGNLYRVAIGLFETDSQVNDAKKLLLAKIKVKNVIIRSFKK